MEQVNRLSTRIEGVSHHPQEGWDIRAVEDALGVAPVETADIAYGVGQRFAIGGAEGVDHAYVELYAERGVARFTNVAEGVQVTLVGQTMPPRLTPDGVVFELPGPARHFSVRNDGSAALIVNTSPDYLPPTTAPRAGDAPKEASQQGKEQGQRGRIEGNLAYDPVFKVTSRQQREIATFVVAEHYTDAQGEPQTVFHRCVAFNTERKRLADHVRDEARQGDTIIAHGNWHEVPITYRNGTQNVERQLWVYGVKITPKDGEHRLPASPEHGPR